MASSQSNYSAIVKYLRMGQVPVSMKALSEMNPALLDKQHSLASINQLLVPKFADVA